MDEIEVFNYHWWQFLCTGEQLTSGSYQAVVRQRVPPNLRFRMISLDGGQHATALQALAHAQTLAMQWARAQKGHGHDQT